MMLWKSYVVKNAYHTISVNLNSFRGLTDFAVTEKGRTMATRIVRDNCKDCTSSCEHAGKDREFVCVKGVSCKTIKPKPEMVAVVRCKDCVYWGNEETKVATEYQLFCVCDDLKRMRKAGNCMTNEDFFCAAGERRTDE